MRNKWASVSTAGTLTLASDLLDLPREVVEYVVVHELLHIRIPDHGKGWQVSMSSYMPDWRERERRLVTLSADEWAESVLEFQPRLCSSVTGSTTECSSFDQANSAVLPRGSIAEDAVMDDLQEFMGNDMAYLEWLRTHPHGFVLNTERGRSPDYMVLHRASCWTIQPSSTLETGAFTERDYRKICATTIRKLRIWVMRNGRPDGSFSSRCQICDPVE